MKKINNTQEMIHTKDVVDRIKELENELETLRKVTLEATNWVGSEDLIRKDYFKKYCQDLCYEIGAIPEDIPDYVSNHIDWEGVANELKYNYAEVDFDGVVYFIRVLPL